MFYDHASLPSLANLGTGILPNTKALNATVLALYYASHFVDSALGQLGVSHIKLRFRLGKCSCLNHRSQ